MFADEEFAVVFKPVMDDDGLSGIESSPTPIVFVTAGSLLQMPHNGFPSNVKLANFGSFRKYRMLSKSSMWLLPNERHSNSVQFSRFSIFVILLLNNDKSVNFFKFSKPSILVIRLKDKSAWKDAIEGTPPFRNSRTSQK